MNIYLIGVGGGGSRVIEKLVKIAKNIIVYDGDTLEEKNLDRQLFPESAIGKNKALAIAEIYGPRVKAKPEYFHSGLDIKFTASDIILCCVDNSVGRKEVLSICDRYGCRSIFAANEYVEAEAYYYDSSMKDTPNDPRIVYPTILTNRDGNPLSREACTGHAQTVTPQLVLANDWSAGMLLQLFWFYTKEMPQLDSETRSYWPVHHLVNQFKFTTIRRGDRQ